MAIKKIKYRLLDCLGLKIHFKLLMLWLKFYYRSCLTRQIFSVIYIFPLLTELIALHLSSWDCLFKSFFYILSHYSTPGTTYKLLPLLIFYSKKQLENLLRGWGEGEREKRRKWDTDLLLLHWGLILFLAPLKTFPKCCFPHLVMMCRREKPNFGACKGKALTVSSSETQILNLYMDTMRRLKEISK